MISKIFIGETLRKYRMLNGLSVKDVVEILKKKGIVLSTKTIYGWEGGKRQPDADTLICLCKIYNIESILEAFYPKEHIQENCNEHTITSNRLDFVIDTLDQQLLSLFHQLNSAGKEAVLTAAEGAVMNSKYVSKSSKETTSTEIDNENHA